MKIYITLIVALLISAAVFSIAMVKGVDHAKVIFDEITGIQSNQSDFLFVDNADRFTKRNFDLVRFSFDRDQSSYVVENFVEIDLCHVRGFPLRSPLFKTKIPPEKLEGFKYFWKYDPLQPQSNAVYGRYTLLALDFTASNGWLLSTRIAESKPPTMDSLLDWQKDPAQAKRDCSDMRT